jgi:hypothetical protein
MGTFEECPIFHTEVFRSKLKSFIFILSGARKMLKFRFLGRDESGSFSILSACSRRCLNSQFFFTLWYDHPTYLTTMKTLAALEQITIDPVKSLQMCYAWFFGCCIKEWTVSENVKLFVLNFWKTNWNFSFSFLPVRGKFSHSDF